MPKYLIQASYSKEGLQGLLKEGGSSRRDAIRSLVEGMGGTLDTFLFAFGDRDLYVIADMPNQESMAALALTAGASGAGSIHTTVLLTPEEIDAAANKTVNYRPPGK